MSYLTENPDVMMEVLAVLVKRAGGSVTVTKEDAPGPFNLLSKWEGGALHLVLENDLTEEDVRALWASEPGSA